MRVTVTGGRSEALLQGLLDRQLSLVVCDMSKFDDSVFAEDIMVQALPSEPLVLVFRADHPAAGQARPDTSLYPWALPSPSPASHERFAEPLRRRLRLGAFPDYELDSTEACLNVARGGRGDHGRAPVAGQPRLRLRRSDLAAPAAEFANQ